MTDVPTPESTSPSVGDASPAPAGSGRRSEGGLAVDAPLRRDIRMLGFELRQVLQRHADPNLVHLLEKMHHLARQRREGHRSAEATLRKLVAGLDDELLGELIRALMCLLDLINLAEDRHRIRVLRQRERERAPSPVPQSIGDAIQTLKDQGVSPDQLQQYLDNLNIELVFTAHPTEAKRRTVRNALNRLRSDLVELDRRDLLPRERAVLLSNIRADLDCLWETDSLRPHKPTVIEEAQRSLYAMASLWQIGPRLYRSLRQSLERCYPGRLFHVPTFLRLGTWIGGDRDGHPLVTASVTRDVLILLRRTALARHISQCDELAAVLGVSERRHPITPALQQALDQALQRWPQVRPAIDRIHPHERYRHWLAILRHRLVQTLEADPDATQPDAAYAHASQLIDDLQCIGESLHANNFHRLADGLLQDWIDRVRMFGFHLARLDIREHAQRLQHAIADLMAAMGIHQEYAYCDEQSRMQLLR